MRENTDLEELQKSASEMSRKEEMSESHGGPRLRRAKPLFLYASDRMADSHVEDSHGHRNYRGALEKDYDSDCSTTEASVEPVESDDDADDSDTDLVAGETIAAISRINRRLRNLDIEHPSSICDDTLAGEPNRRRFGRTRGPRFEETCGPRSGNLDHTTSGTQSSSIHRQGLSSTTRHSGVQSGDHADLLHGDGSVLNPVDRFESAASGRNTSIFQHED